MNRGIAWILLTASSALLPGCASFDGRGLVPGKSTASEVQSLMGEPAERLKRPSGDAVWYYSRLPEGRATYAVTIGADGVMRSIEQRLTRANLAKLALDRTTRNEVRELFGPPFRTARAVFKPHEVWEYPWREYEDRRILWISFSDDGVMREVIEMHDVASDTPSGFLGPGLP